MPDESRNSLELDAVVRRFAESAEALTNVRGHLQVLTEIRKSEEKANASLQETAGQVADFVSGAAKVLQGLEEAQAKVAEVLKVGADLLDGTEMRGIAESVKENSESLSGVHGRVDALESQLAELRAIAADSRATMKQGMDSMVEQVRVVQGRLTEVGESVNSNSQSLSGVHARHDALEARSTEIMNALSTLQDTVDRGVDNLNDGIKGLQVDVKTPIIVKRLF